MVNLQLLNFAELATENTRLRQDFVGQAEDTEKIQLLIADYTDCTDFTATKAQRHEEKSAVGKYHGEFAVLNFAENI